MKKLQPKSNRRDVNQDQILPRKPPEIFTKLENIYSYNINSLFYFSSARLYTWIDFFLRLY